MEEMEKAEEILQALLEKLQADKELSQKIKKFHLVNGLMLTAFPAVSLSIDNEHFEEYDNAMDNVTAEAKLVYYIESADAEKAEREVRKYARIIRKILNQDVTVGGNVNYIRTKKIEYASVDVERNYLVYAAEITAELQWFGRIGRERSW